MINDLKKVYFKNKSSVFYTMVFSIGFAVLILLQTKIIYNNSTKVEDYTGQNNLFMNYRFADIIVFIIQFIIFYSILSLTNLLYNRISKKSKKQKDNKFSFKKEWLMCFTILLTFNTIYFLINAPGFVDYDSFNQLAQALGYVKLNNHHPVVITLIYRFFMLIGGYFNNYNLGISLISFTQILFTSCSLGYFLAWFRKKTNSRIITLIALLYFICNTVFAGYSIILWKDPIYSIFLLLMTIKLYDIIESEGEILNNKKTILELALLYMAISFSRNNGVIVSILIIVILTVLYRKKMGLYIVNFTSLTFIILVQLLTLNKPGMKTESYEYLAMPLQQIAYTICNDGNISNADRDFLYKMLPEKIWRKYYNPFLNDTIKGNKYFNLKFLDDNKMEFFKIWIRTLIKNPIKCFKASCMENFGFWSFETKSNYGFLDTFIWEKSRYYKLLNLRQTNYLQKYLGIKFNKNLHQDYNHFIGAGTLMFIMFTCTYLLLRMKKTKYIICLLPPIINWITIIILTPVAFSLRYVFVLAYALPLLIVLPLISNRKTEGSFNEQ